MPFWAGKGILKKVNDREEGKERIDMKEYCYLEHTFEPVYDKESRVLILGSFPSVKSRENQFYYGHPQNRFWKVMAEITGEKLPVTVEEKKELLLKNHIAVWDVIKSCRIAGSSDSSIQDVVVNDFSRILGEAKIEKIYANGSKACELYQKYAFAKTGRAITKLPSTSPANAAYRLDRLCEEWRIALPAGREEEFHDMDEIIRFLDKRTADGVSRIRVQMSGDQAAGTVKEQYHHGRCDIGSPWATGTVGNPGECDI